MSRSASTALALELRAGLLSMSDDEDIRTTLAECINLDDFERAAERTMKPKTWAYYHSSSDDGCSFQRNRKIWSKLRFRPRVLVDVENVDTSTTIFGQPSSLPFFAGPAALGRLAHKEGEVCIVRGCGQAGIPYATSSTASVSHKELAEACTPDQTLFYQLYVSPDKEKSKSALREARKLGYKAVLVTVDVPVAGNRELDNRVKLDATAVALSGVVNHGGAEVGKRQSTASSAGIDPALKWEDIAWIREASGLPIAVKGIQSVEDAAKAYEYGVEGIILSNHGGRQLNSSLTPLEVLLEIRHHRPDLLDNMDVIIDGGIRRGTDVVMALCLGAKACSLGRPFMYALPFGEAGPRKVAAILEKEIKTAMRLLGATSLADLRPSMVNAKRVEEVLYVEAKL